jgi:glutathione peroxidase-family protein
MKRFGLQVAFGILPFVLACAAARAAEEEGAAKKAAPKKEAEAMPESFYKAKVKDIDGKDVDLRTFEGKVVMVVNVASKCGLTERQYTSLEPLYRKYKEKGFEVLAFPANDFGKQEPGTNLEIKEFCAARKVSFKLFSKISVKGDDIHPLYRLLTSKEKSGEHGGEIRWNFDKFLLGRDGSVIGRYEPRLDPLDAKVTNAIEEALEKSPPKAEAKAAAGK